MTWHFEEDQQKCVALASKCESEILRLRAGASLSLKYAVWHGIQFHVDEITPGIRLPVRDSGQ